jgi:NitT/TauT family transport system substrate-binding protein
MLKRRTILQAGAAVLAAPYVARAQALTRVTFRMNWTWQGHMGPFFLGRDRNFFREAGIDLELGEGRGSATTVRLVGNKQDMFGLNDTGTMMFAVSEGITVKHVFTLSDSDLCAIWIEGRTPDLRSARDLVGKRIAVTAGDSLHQLFPAVLAANGLDIRQMNMVFVDAAAKVPALREGRVDVLLGGASDQPVILRHQNVPAKFLTFTDMNFRTVGLGISVHNDTLQSNADLVRRFVGACQRSYAAAVADPGAAIDALLRTARLEREVMLGSLNAIIGLIQDRRRIGFADPAAMQSTLDALKQHRGLNTTQPATAFYTNDLLQTLAG